MREQYVNIPPCLTQVSGTISLTRGGDDEHVGHQVAIFADTKDENNTVIVHGWKDGWGSLFWNGIRDEHPSEDYRVARAIDGANKIVTALERADCRIIGKKTKFRPYPVYQSLGKLDRSNKAPLSVPTADLGRVAF